MRKSSKDGGNRSAIFIDKSLKNATIVDRNLFKISDELVFADKKKV